MTTVFTLTVLHVVAVCSICSHYFELRWPWPLFRLLYDPLDMPSQTRKVIAMKVLGSDISTLEHNTKKIKLYCDADLKHIATTGCVEQGCLLHAILVISSQNLSLDAGELESLNSMIKTATSTYNNMSLELLSSRVNCRKTLMLATHGQRTFQETKQAACALATSSMLYQGIERDVLGESFRWTPPEPVPHILKYSPLAIDPGIQLSKAEKWAVKFNSTVMKKLLQHQKSDSVLTPGLSIVYETHTSFYVCCELGGRTCQCLLLEPRSKRDQPDNLTLLVPAGLGFVSSLRAIASSFEDLQDKPKCVIPLNMVQLKLCGLDRQTCAHLESHETRRLHYTVVETELVATLRRRKEYTKRKPQACAEADSDNEGDEEDEPSPDLLNALEQELYGECEDTMLDAELMTDEMNQDLADLEELHSKFVAAAAERRHDGRNTKHTDADEAKTSANTTSSEDRSFEDEVAESVLTELLESDDLPREACNESTRGIPMAITITEEMITKCLKTWAHKVQMSLEACRFMADQLATFEVDRLDTCLGSNVSLLIHSSGGSVDDSAEVAFVSWVKPYRNLEGRIVSLDEDRGLIYPSHFLPRLKFFGSIMISHATGSRIRKKGRETMQRTVLCLQSMFQAGLDSGAFYCETDLLSDQFMVCAACGDGSTTTSPVKRCSCCLLSWHHACSRTVGSNSASFIVTEDAATLYRFDLRVGDLPVIFLPMPEL